jgi:riboflavin kinase / FMN adenylyltransferase
MLIHRGNENPVIINPVVTTGVFDGVHSGHRVLLDRVVKLAHETNGESVVLTFDPHPRLVLSEKHEGISFLSTLEEKIRLLGAARIDHIVIVDFNKELARLSAFDFIRIYLVEKIRTKHLVVGYDHHFGRGREGDINTVRLCGKKFGFEVEQMERVTAPEGIISSTVIREALLAGSLEEANRLLGYSYSITGTVVKGREIGHKLGFPTANIEPSDIYKLIPADGVYAVEVVADGQLLKGVLSIGFNPTVNKDETRRTVEVNIFNFDGDLYGNQITVVFRYRLRDEIRFESPSKLSEQMKLDKMNAIRLLS